MSSWRWWLSWAAVPLWGALAFLLWSGANALANRALARELDRVRGAAQPLVPAQSARPFPPDEDNAAFLFLRAMAILKPSGGAWDRAAFTRDWSRGADLAPLAELWVSANAPALEDLRKAAALPACRFPIDYSKGVAPDAPGFLSSGRCAELLACAARLAHERGDADEADRLIAALLRLGVAMGGEPMLSTAVAGFSVFKAGFDLCQTAFDTGLRPGPATRALIRSLRPGMFQEALVDSLLLERSMLLSFFLSRPAPIDPSTPFAHRLVLWAPFRPYLKWDLARFCRLFGDAIRHAHAPSESGAWTRPDAEDILLRGGWLARSLIPHFPTLALLSIEGDVQADLLRCALRAIETSETTGTWPARTSMRDRFTGRPLSIRLDAGMLTVSSAGRDLVEDGGDPERDLVIRLGR